MERALTMVDGVLLLVDASEGPLPQTRFVLRKALELKLPVVLVINKVDRSDARPAEVVNEVYELFLDLDADSSQIEFPIVYANARAGRAGLDRGRARARSRPAVRDAARRDPGAELRPRASAAGARHESRREPVRRPARAAAGFATGRCARARRSRGAVRTGRSSTARVTELYLTEALDRVPADAAGPGEIVALAGLPEVTIGETIADPDDPRPLPVTTVDEPSLSVTIGINTSPLAGTEGTRLTASQVKERLDAELVGNVSLRVVPTARPDAWEVQGRGELQLAILVELMRREGFELTVGKPEVLTKEVDGRRLEPVERVAIDIPEEFIGVVTQLLALRKGTAAADGEPRQRLGAHGLSRARPRADRLSHRVPHRVARHRDHPPRLRGWEPWHGELRTRPTGSLVADRRGQATAFAIAQPPGARIALRLARATSCTRG